MRLPDPNSPDENDVHFVRKERQTEEVLDLGPVDFRRDWLTCVSFRTGDSIGEVREEVVGSGK